MEAVEVAYQYWESGILDRQALQNGKKYNGDTDKIMEIIRNGGGKFWYDWVIKTGGYSEGYRVGLDGKTYPGVEWCGFFAGACFIDLDPKIKKFVIASTKRLASFDAWGKAGYIIPTKIDPEDIQPNDIVVVYNKKSANDSVGDHITLAASKPDRGIFRTFEGNAYGQSNSGQRVEGVVKNSRNLKEVANVVRFEKIHFK